MRKSTLALATLLAFNGASAFADNDIIAEWAEIKPPPAPVLKPVDIDAGTTALILMDFDKNSCVPAKRARCAAALPAVSALLAGAREHHVLIAHFFNKNMTRDDIVASIAPKGDERVEQASGDKFYGTKLGEFLRAKGVKTVILAGTSANGAVLTTALGAYEEGFKAVVPIDTMPADTAWQEQFSAWNIASGPAFREISTLTRSSLVNYK